VRLAARVRTLAEVEVKQGIARWARGAVREGGLRVFVARVSNPVVSNPGHLARSRPTHRGRDLRAARVYIQRMSPHRTSPAAVSAPPFRVDGGVFARAFAGGR